MCAARCDGRQPARAVEFLDVRQHAKHDTATMLGQTTRGGDTLPDEDGRLWRFARPHLSWGASPAAATNTASPVGGDGFPCGLRGVASCMRQRALGWSTNRRQAAGALRSAVVLISHSAPAGGDLRHKTTTLIRLSHRCRHRLRNSLSICPSRPAIPFAFATIALSGSVDAECTCAVAASGSRCSAPTLTMKLTPPHVALLRGRRWPTVDVAASALASEADVVLFARGGYGLSRLLDRIDWSDVAASQKCLRLQ